MVSLLAIPTSTRHLSSKFYFAPDFELTRDETMSAAKIKEKL